MMSGDKITPTKESSDSHVTKSQEEEDEGEILSDDEEMDTSQKSQGPPSARCVWGGVGVLCMYVSVCIGTLLKIFHRVFVYIIKFPTLLRAS